jgi:hypothetical protein
MLLLLVLLLLLLLLHSVRSEHLLQVVVQH